MAPAAEKPVWYRAYVLLVLLAVCICNLALRNLPSYLITVPVPDCEEVCHGVSTAPLCGSGRPRSFPPDRLPSKEEFCQLCRARALPPLRANLSSPPPANLSSPPPANLSSPPPANLSSPPPANLSSLPPANLSSLPLANLGSVQQRPKQRPLLHRRRLVALWGPSAPELPFPAPVVPWAGGPSEDAAFYNLADGTCLYHWEYGLLIGFGFAIVFAVGSVPAGYVCDRRPRVAILSAAVLVWSVATSLQAAGHSFMFLLCCRAVIGLSQAFCLPAAVSITADYFTERQNAAVVLLSVGLYLGSGCASFSVLFAALLGWRWAVLLGGLLGVALTPVLYWTVQEPERTEWSAPCPISVVTDEVFEKSRVARMLIVAGSAKMLAAFSLGAFLPIWYARRGLEGYSSVAYACWNSLVISAGGLLAAFLGSCLGNCWSRRDPRAPCWVGLLGAVASLPLVCLVLLTSSFGASMLCLFLLLLLGENWLVPTVGLLQASVRRSVRGQAVSVFLSASMLAGNLGPAVVGFLDPGGERIGLHLLWITLTANCAAAAAFVWTAREISIDPVAAGLGSRPEGNYQEAEVTRKASTAPWAF